MTGEANPKPRRRSSFGLTAAILLVFVAGMVGMSYAAVPLYRIFCQVTGYGGTTRRAQIAPKKVLDRVVTVRFDSNISNNLGWSFRPLKRQVQVKLGEVGTVSFQAENRTDKTETGTAAFNVAPDQAGAYFNKIACFCFTDQNSQARREVGARRHFLRRSGLCRRSQSAELRHHHTVVQFLSCQDATGRLSGDDIGGKPSLTPTAAVTRRGTILEHWNHG